MADKAILGDKKDIWAQLDAYNAKYGEDANGETTSELKPEPKKKKKKKANSGLVGTAKQAFQGRVKSLDDRIKLALGKKK